jgi:hypothetical protein
VSTNECGANESGLNESGIKECNVLAASWESEVRVGAVWETHGREGAAGRVPAASEIQASPNTHEAKYKPHLQRAASGVCSDKSGVNMMEVPDIDPYLRDLHHLLQRNQRNVTAAARKAVAAVPIRRQLA